MAIGDHAGFGITSGNSNICLGAGAGSNQTTGDNNIYIGDAGALGESNMIAIGARSDGYFIQIGGPYSSTLIGGDSSSTYIGGYNGYGYTEIGTNGETDSRIVVLIA